MEKKKLQLSELITSQSANTISGRATGEAYNEKNNILEELENGQTFEIIIGPEIQAINDSFWKGFFSSVMKKYKSQKKIEELFSFVANEYIKKSIEKNLQILEIIVNSK